MISSKPDVVIIINSDIRHVVRPRGIVLNYCKGHPLIFVIY